MEVLGAAQNSSKAFEEAISGNVIVENAARNQYLEGAGGHYVNATIGRDPEKREQTSTCGCGIVNASLVAADCDFDQAVESMGAFNVEALSRSTSITAQLADVVSRLRVIRNEMGRMDARVLDTMTGVSLDTGNAKESLLKGMLESNSLQKTVETLKAELENWKREHAELKDNDLGSESAPKSRQSRFFHRKPENEGRLADKVQSRLGYKGIVENKNEIKELKIKARGSKRERDSSKTWAEVEKRPRITPNINEAKECRLSAIDASKNLPEKMNTTSVSTSESTAKILTFEDELESSTQQSEKSNNLERGNLAVIKGRIASDKHDSTSDFNIRDYVFSARKKDISTNWPFSQKKLHLCLEHGVTNVLPPFQPDQLLRDACVKRCMAEKSVSSEESNFNKRSAMAKNHLLSGTTIDHRWNQNFTEGCKNLGSFPSLGEKDVAFQTAVICQSEVGSVSTSNLPLSETVSDQQEAAASAANRTKSSVSQIFVKKRGVALKLPVNSRRGPPEDITSACTVPSEAIAAKICPVCESFSSSSNTTLNAHIDQCLSSESSPNWVNNSKLISPRINPRKMRSMVDICATALPCTLEDLDRRNGSNWATNLDIPSEDTVLSVDGSNHRVSSRYTVNNRDDGSVYIDSNGRKIRILSKLNETVPLSFRKPRKDPKVRKHSNKGKICKLLSECGRRRLVKHLKYLRVTRQRKHLLSLKVKGRSAKACPAQEATYAGHESHMEHQPPGSFGKALKVQEEKNYVASETSNRSMSLKIILEKKNDLEITTKVCRYDLRARSDHTITGKILHKKRSQLPKKPVNCTQRRLTTSAFDSQGAEQKSPGSAFGKATGSPRRSENHGNRKTFLVPLKLKVPGLNGENTKESAWKFLDSGATTSSSLEREIETQTDAVHNTESRKLLHSCHAYLSEEMRSYDSATGMLSPNLSYAGELKGSDIDNSFGCGRDEETEAWSTDSGKQSGAKQGCSQDSASENIRFSERSDGGQGKHGFAKSTEIRHGSGKTDTGLNPSLEPESHKVADVSACLSEPVLSTDKFQRSLSKDESKAYLPQHVLRNEHMFSRDVSAIEGSELKMVNANFNFGQESSIMEIDPILIPGPPGSDLPSFWDMGSKDRQRTSSLSTGVEQFYGDEDNVVNGDSSDSHLSATSTIFNLGVTTDHHIYPGWLGAGSSMDTLTVSSQSPAVKTSVNDLKDDFSRGQRCCCSRKEEIPWSTSTKFHESHLNEQRMASLVTYPGEHFTDSTLTNWPCGLGHAISFSTCQRIETENLVNPVQTLYQNITPVEVSAERSETAAQSRGIGDCDSTSPPILRLMGKDLRVGNEEDGPSIQNRQWHPVTENNSMHDKFWEHPFSQSSGLIVPLPSEKNPHFLSAQCFNVGPLNMINSFGSSNYTSGDMYVDKHMHSSFSVLGEAPLERLAQ